MNPTSLQPSALLARLRQRPVLAGVLVLILLLVAVLSYSLRSRGHEELSYFEVRRGDFLISVVEGGTIEAVNDISIRSDFEGTARIIFIVKEGSYVKKGDVLVELDSSQAQDQVNQQQIAHEKNLFAVTQAEQQLTIQKSIVDGETQTAELKLKFAEIDLDKYLKGSRDQERRNAEIQISTVVSDLKLAEDKLEWTRKLYEKGWETKNNYDGETNRVFQLRLRKEQAEKAMWILQEFDERKSLETLQADVHEATENLARVKLQGERRLAQYQADLETQRTTLDLSAKKLERDRKQLEACRITAPQDGLVVYAGASGDRRFSSESMIEEGATVRNRQEIIKLPDTSEMKLEVKIHEAHINNIHQGQQAFVVLDSMPDKRFQGVVSKVGVVPDMMSRWGNPNLKLYATQILITEKLPNVKPGVSARAEVVITNLTGVVTVPIQAVTTRKGRQVVFTPGDPPVATPVTVGLYNTKFIEITSGLEPGNRVLLSPPFDTDEKDLGGAILAKGETPPPAPTNALPPQSRSAGPPSLGMAAPGPDPGLGEAAAPGAARPGMEGGRGAGRQGRQGGPRNLPPEVLKEFDKDGNGELDDTERAAMMASMRERFGNQFGGPGGGQGGNRMSREDMLKQYDKNGDGEIDETEREAMRAAMRERLGNRGGQGGAGDAQGDGPRGGRRNGEAGGNPADGPRSPAQPAP